MRIRLILITALALVTALALWAYFGRRSGKDLPSAEASNPKVVTPVEIDYAPARVLRASLNEGMLGLSGLAAPGSTIILSNDKAQTLEDTQTDKQSEALRPWALQYRLPTSLPAGTIVPYSVVTVLPDGRRAQSNEVIALITPPSETQDDDFSQSPPRPEYGAALVALIPGARSRVFASPYAQSADTQSALQLAANAQGPFTVSALDYDGSGGVIFSGRAGQGDRIAAFVAGVPLGQTNTDERGEWALIAGAALPPEKVEIEIQHYLTNSQAVNDRFVLSLSREPSDQSAQTLPQEAPITARFGPEGLTLRRVLRRGGFQTTFIPAPRQQIKSDGLETARQDGEVKP